MCHGSDLLLVVGGTRVTKLSDDYCFAGFFGNTVWMACTDSSSRRETIGRPTPDGGFALVDHLEINSATINAVAYRSSSNGRDHYGCCAFE